MVRNRPDVQMAEYNYQQAFEALNVAKADVFPALNITAAFGLSSLKIKDLFRDSLCIQPVERLARLFWAKEPRELRLRFLKLRKNRHILLMRKV
jgi:hypothetical protein